MKRQFATHCVLAGYAMVLSQSIVMIPSMMSYLRPGREISGSTHATRVTDKDGPVFIPAIRTFLTCLQSGSPGLPSVCVKVMYLSGSSVGYPGDENETGDIYKDVNFVLCMIRGEIPD